MNSRKIAEQAGFVFGDTYWTERDLTPLLERFAELVVANIDPKSFMTYHEGYEAGVTHERQECAKVCDAHGLFMTAQEIRTRGKA